MKLSRRLRHKPKSKLSSTLIHFLFVTLICGTPRPPRLSLTTPPNFGGGGGSCFASIVVVALGEPGVRVNLLCLRCKQIASSQEPRQLKTYGWSKESAPIINAVAKLFLPVGGFGALVILRDIGGTSVNSEVLDRSVVLPLMSVCKVGLISIGFPKNVLVAIAGPILASAVEIELQEKH
jgi:hypothetical protein